MLEQVADFLANLRAPGLTQHDHALAGSLKVLLKEADLRGFTATFGAFEGEQEAGHGLDVGHGGKNKPRRTGSGLFTALSGDVEQKHFRFGKGGRRGYLRRPMTDSTSLQFGTRDSKQAIEEGLAFAPKFDEHGLIAAMAVDADTNEPLMLAYMNADTLRKTLEIGQAVYYSRSRKTEWHKGATSGEFQDVIEIRTDCDQDALILRVKQHGGGCCHTKRASCFYRKVTTPSEGGTVMLEKVL